jgi:hypothetical protein
MKLESQWTFECLPEHVWPHFFNAKMDRTRPFMFRFGIPKPLSCRVLEGVPAVGNTRQCTTDKGTINQHILVMEPGRRLTYRMKDSTIWCRSWVGHLEDTFILTLQPDGRTEVRRSTRFSGAGLFKGFKTMFLWIALRQAHRYAAKNWRRLALETKVAPAAFEPVA